jgi:prepilin-type N-terminal cleavage/methylation domain-containing protein
MKTTARGFTIIELLFVIVLFGVAGIIFFVQKNNLEVGSRDDQRKVAINAMYYSLENVYYAQHNYYPVSIDSSVLPSVDPALFTDPSGHKIGDSQSDYRYQATNCTNNQCKSYTLRSTLQNEADYVKTSEHS